MALPGCPRCGNNTFEHFIFIHGHSLRSEGGTECIHKRWVRCDACRLPLKWKKGWQVVSEAEFEREVEDHRRRFRDSFIKPARVFEYDDNGWNCRESRFELPAWNQIEEAIRRLNKFQAPFVWFFSSLDAFEDAVPEIEVLGGDGDYVVAVTDSSGSHRRIRFAREGERWIPVWLSDQGCEAHEKFVCHDVDQVLAIIRRFDEFGSIPPDLEFE